MQRRSAEAANARRRASRLAASAALADGLEAPGVGAAAPGPSPAAAAEAEEEAGAAEGQRGGCGTPHPCGARARAPVRRPSRQRPRWQRPSGSDPRRWAPARAPTGWLRPRRRPRCRAPPGLPAARPGRCPSAVQQGVAKGQIFAAPYRTASLQPRQPLMKSGPRLVILSHYQGLQGGNCALQAAHHGQPALAHTSQHVGGVEQAPRLGRRTVTW